MPMDEPVHYTHRTVRVAIAPPTRGDQTMPLSPTITEPAKTEKRKKKLTSILPETLDVITESSEHSESSSSSYTAMNESVIQSPARKASSPKRISASPRKVKLPKVPAPATINDDDSDDNEGDASPPTRKSGKPNLPPTLHAGHPETIPEENENDSTGETDKLTQTESEGGDEDSGNEEGSDDSIDVVPKMGSLFSYLQNPGVTMQHVSEVPSFDADNSVMMFDYDGDENDDGDFSTSKHSVASSTRNGEDDDELTWRLDPSQSLSDWTITVISKGKGTAEHYHVHKSVLAVGKRKSDYFAGIFRDHRRAQSRNAGNRSCATELIFPDTAAMMVPILFDYMYTNDKALTLSSETAPGLRYLAQFFGIKVLFEKIMEFIQKDLSLKTLVPYYKGSSDLGDKKVLGIAARHAARNIHLIDVSHSLISVMDPTFFCKVLSSPGLEGVEKKMHLSVLVAKYCQLHKDSLEGQVFLKITSEEHLPHIHHTAALSLLGMEADLVVATSVMSMMTITNLQERCIKGLASNWRELTESDPSRTAHICRKLPSVVVTELLLRSLESAKKDDTRPGATRVMVKRGSQRGKPKDEAAMKKEYDEALEKLKAEFEEKTSHLQELCYEKDKHIKGYYEELSKYQRLPNTLDGKLVASGRSAQPTMMPAVGKHVVDGYVFVGKKKSCPKYPLFDYKGEEK